MPHATFYFTAFDGSDPLTFELEVSPHMSRLKKVGSGFLAAITSPTVVKQERSLAAMIAGRVLLAAGASTGLVDLIVRIVHG